MLLPLSAKSSASGGRQTCSWGSSAVLLPPAPLAPEPIGSPPRFALCVIKLRISGRIQRLAPGALSNGWCIQKPRWNTAAAFAVLNFTSKLTSSSCLYKSITSSLRWITLLFSRIPKRLRARLSADIKKNPIQIVPGFWSWCQNRTGQPVHYEWTALPLSHISILAFYVDYYTEFSLRKVNPYREFSFKNIGADKIAYAGAVYGCNPRTICGTNDTTEIQDGKGGFSWVISWSSAHGARFPAVPNALRSIYQEADGDQLKVMLWLLRHNGRPYAAETAAALGITPQRVDTALGFWMKKAASFAALTPPLDTAPLRRITWESPHARRAAAEAPPTQPQRPHRAEAYAAPGRALVSPERVESSPEIRRLVEEAQNLLGKTLSPALSGTSIQGPRRLWPAVQKEVILMLIAYANKIGRANTSFSIESTVRTGQIPTFEASCRGRKSCASSTKLAIAWKRAKMRWHTSRRAPSKIRASLLTDGCSSGACPMSFKRSL